MATPRTESYLLNSVFQDNQADGSISASDMRDFVASARYLQPLGWEFRFDGQYTQGSPMTLADGVPQKITFTSNPGEDLRYPSTFPEIWNSVDQKLDISTFLNGFGVVRLSFRGDYASGQAPHIDFFIDAGSDPLAPAGSGTASNIIYEGTQLFAKGTATTQAFNFMIPLFGGSSFVTNGGQFIVESSGNTCDIWEIALTAGAILVPNPAGEG